MVNEAMRSATTPGQTPGNDDADLALLSPADRERAKAWERDIELLLPERELNRRRRGRGGGWSCPPT